MSSAVRQLPIQPCVDYSQLSQEQERDIPSGNTATLTQALNDVFHGESVNPDQVEQIRSITVQGHSLVLFEGWLLPEKYQWVKRPHEEGGARILLFLNPVIGVGEDAVEIRLESGHPMPFASAQQSGSTTPTTTPPHTRVGNPGSETLTDASMTPDGLPPPPRNTPASTSPAHTNPSSHTSTTPHQEPPANAAQQLFNRREPPQVLTPGTPTPAPRNVRSSHTLVQSTTAVEARDEQNDVDMDAARAENGIQGGPMTLRQLEAVQNLAVTKADALKNKLKADEEGAKRIDEIYMEQFGIHASRLKNEEDLRTARQSHWDKFEREHDQLVAEVMRMPTVPPPATTIPSLAPASHTGRGLPRTANPGTGPTPSPHVHGGSQETDLPLPVGRLSQNQYAPFMKEAESFNTIAHITRNHGWVPAPNNTQSSNQTIFDQAMDPEPEAPAGIGRGILSFFADRFTGNKRKRSDEEGEVVEGEDPMERIGRRGFDADRR